MSKYIVIIAALMAITGKSPAEALPSTAAVIDGQNTQQVFALVDQIATQTIAVSIIVVKKTVAAAEIWCANHKEP